MAELPKQIGVNGNFFAEGHVLYVDSYVTDIEINILIKAVVPKIWSLDKEIFL